MATAPEVHAFARQANGSRIRTFELRGIKVSIESGEERDDKAEALAAKLANFSAGIDRTWTEIEARAERAVNKAREAEARALAAEAKLPPATPSRLLGPGFVRFDDKGQLWLLNKRETGWSSFGVVLDGWDDLFRRFNVKVTDDGNDEFGCWWCVENCEVQP